MNLAAQLHELTGRATALAMHGETAQERERGAAMLTRLNRISVAISREP